MEFKGIEAIVFTAGAPHVVLVLGDELPAYAGLKAKVGEISRTTEVTKASNEAIVEVDGEASETRAVDGDSAEPGSRSTRTGQATLTNKEESKKSPLYCELTSPSDEVESAGDEVYGKTMTMGDEHPP